MKKKNIAFIISSLNSGGAERVVSTLSNELSNSYNVHIIVFAKGTPFYKLNKKVQFHYCLPHIGPSKNIFGAVRNNFSLYKKVSELFNIHKIDLGIAFLTSSNIIATLAARKNNIPIIISERNNPSTDKTNFFWNTLRKLLYPKADKLVVQTSLIQSFFTSWIDSSKLHILPNPISPELKIEASDEYEKENIILNVGRLTNQKGQDILIKAFANINPTGWKLYIIGQGNKKNEYQKLIHELNLEESIILLGRKQNIQEYYKSAKIFAFPSRYEGFPNALIEAMHMGLPCISTDCPTGPSELIKDNENGFLTQVDHLAEFTSKLSQLIEDKALRAKFSKLSPLAVQHLTVETVSNQWEDLINSALIDYYNKK
ncbi:glycosyltransferase family 4 protein [Zobellia russellii]|uniref:glycosyltransferase family 4 protein n=1 Tax=Zobellia russellii TaxID=248907 RepID=UPI001BFF6D0A|nr:glycosyltransferase family 4 protein [Zobellia russellii]MBT9189033.1 glycosyltransferase family 4 protein [Zobellia russellii]